MTTPSAQTPATAALPVVQAEPPVEPQLQPAPQFTPEPHAPQAPTPAVAQQLAPQAIPPQPIQPQYQAPAQPQPLPQAVPYQPQPASAPSNGVALTAMILGIVGAVVGFWAVIPITGYFSAAFGFPLALAAVICGHIGRTRSKRIGGVGRIQALVGFLLGYVSIAVMVVASAAWTLFLFVGAV